MPLHETSISAVEMGVFCYTGNSGIGKFSATMNFNSNQTPHATRRENNMKKLLAITAAAAVMAMAGTAMAADADLDVSATVLGVCTMVGGSLDFGQLDPTNPIAHSANSTGVTVTCTNGTAYTITSNNGANASGSQKRLASGSNYIPYSITLPASTSGTGAAQTVTIAGAIAAGAYTTSPAGTYTDTVVLSVSP
jgi:spore coat protein U-like protein